MPGTRAQRGDVAHRLVRVARAAGDEARERADVDAPSCPRSRCCRSARSGAGREEAGERVARPAAGPASAIAPGLRDHVLLGDAALEEAVGEALPERDRARCRARRSASSATSRGSRSAAADERLAVGGDEPLRARRGAGARAAPRSLERDRRRRRAPPSRASSRATSSSSARSYSSGAGRAGVEAVERGRRRGQVVRLHERDAGALAACRRRAASGRSALAVAAPRASRRTRRRSWPSQRADRPAERRDLRLEVAEVADLARPRCRTGACCGRRSR